jgi:hypothetical protein
MDWAMIRGAMETGGCIFILVGSSWALIPKDQIPAADFVALKQILRAHCPSTARF